MSERITPSLVISLIALAVALGGVSYAAIKIPKNSVGTKQLKKGAVGKAKLKKGSVSKAKLKGGSVATAKLKGGSVTTAKLGDGAVDSSKLGEGSVTASKLGGASVGLNALQDDSVDSPKVIDGSLNRADFAPGQITGDAWYADRESIDLLDVTTELEAIVTTPVLPAGSYVLAGRANVLGGGTDSVLICSLRNDTAQNFTVDAGDVFPLSMAAVAVLDEPESIELRCSKSSGAPKIAQAHIVVTQVNGVTGAN